MEGKNIEVRLDKYLWSMRLYKTRSDATEACRTGRVKINDADGKPSKIIKAGDLINLRKGSIHYTYKVLTPIDKRQGAKSVDIYIENLTPQEELDKLNAPIETIFLSRERGTGRPTKKERRLIDKMLDN